MPYSEREFDNAARQRAPGVRMGRAQRRVLAREPDDWSRHWVRDSPDAREGDRAPAIPVRGEGISGERAGGILSLGAGSREYPFSARRGDAQLPDATRDPGHPSGCDARLGDSAARDADQPD